MRLVGVACSTSVCGANGGAGSLPPFGRDRREAAERLGQLVVVGQVLEVADQERAAARAGPLARRKARIASRVNVRRWSSGPEHGAPERVVAERRAVDQVLGDDRRLVVRARDLLDHDAALAVELLGVDLRAADEVGQQVDRLAGHLGAARDVERDEVVRRVRVQHRAHPLGGLVDLAVVVVLLAALEHQVLEEVGHPVLLRPLGPRAGVEGHEHGGRPRARQLDAVEREPVGEGRGSMRAMPDRTKLTLRVWPRAPDRARGAVDEDRVAARVLDLAEAVGPQASGESLAATSSSVPRASRWQPSTIWTRPVRFVCHRRSLLQCRFQEGACPAHEIPPWTRWQQQNDMSAWSAPRGRRRHRLPERREALPERRHRARRRDLRHPPGRVRLPRRRVRLGQVDDDAAADQGDRADRRHDPRRRPRPGEDPAPQRPVLPPQPRRGLPGLQAAAEPHGVRERRLRAAGHRRQRGARSARRCRTSCA